MEIPDNIKNYDGKKNSAFFWILYEYSKDEFLIDLNNKLDSAKKIKDSFQKNISNNVYYNLINKFENNYLENNLNLIIFSTCDFIEIIKLSKKSISILKNFKCKKNYSGIDSKFDIEFIDKYINDDSYIKLISVHDTNFEIKKISYTKCCTDYSETHKNKTIDEFIDDNCNNEKFILSGDSFKLKNYKEKPNMLFFIKTSKGFNPFDIMNEYNNYLNLKKIEEIKKIILLLNNEKEMDRVIFGKNEVSNALVNGFLEELYCNKILYYNLIDNIKKNELKLSTKIEFIEVDQSNQETKILKNYGGIIGLKYNWAKNF